VRCCRHATHAPRADRSVGRDEADRDQLLTVEGANRKRGGGLVQSQLFERLVRSQDGLPQPPRLRERHSPHEHLYHGRDPSREATASAVLAVVHARSAAP
jgi:hypothetical protein